MKVRDYFVQGCRGWVWRHEQGGKEHELPSDHNLELWTSTPGLDCADCERLNRGPLFKGAQRTVAKVADKVDAVWVRRSETNRPSKCLEDTRGELARKGLTHRRMSNDSPKIKWSCQRVNEQVGVDIPRQFSGCDGLLNQV